MTLLSSLLVLVSLPLSAAAPPAKEKAKSAQSIAELQQGLEKILADTHTPGVSVAIVHRDGPEWVAGLGKANVAANAPVTDATLFRIGSTSKAFASLSILKLASEGKLSLMDPVRKLVPEIWFENRWEASDPVLVVDLLEHTTGWDDMHMPEYAKDAKGMTLRQGLDYYKHSRYSRWPPGTRMAYCNSGPSVAAYIVEKVTRQRYEDYVTQNFFLPIGMATATYFEQPSPQLTTLYHWDGKTPYPYWNILERPAGSINASARDMAAYVQFYLDRGSVGGKEVVPAATIDRMETPTRTWAAQQGLKAGYGLSDYTTIHEGFVYHGHNGGVEGGLTEMAYLPEYGVGYSYSINAGNGSAFEQIGEAIRGYITRGLTAPAVPAAGALPADVRDYAGWYEPNSPRNQFMNFMERLGLRRVRFAYGNLETASSFGMLADTFVPVSGEQFRYLPLAGRAEPIATMALLTPNEEGRFIQMGETWKRIPTWMAIGEIAMKVWFVLALVAILLYAPFWMLGGLSKRRRRPAERAIRLWPLIAALSAGLTVLIFQKASGEIIERLGNVTAWSVGLCVSTLVFGIAAAASVLALLLARKKEVRGFVYWGSVTVIVPLAIAAVYFACWGVIGIRMWA
jgi:CubicO group peptidase (beta-lactamase class C family)